MYNGFVDEELKEYYKKYYEKFKIYADGYDELDGCEDMEYDEFLAAIKYCLKTGKHMTEVIK